MITVQKRTMAFLAAVTCAGLLSANIAHAYDGDVDYSAPYVTLDPETGKLITVDPKQEQAAAQQATQHEGTGTDASTTAAANPVTNAGVNVDETSTDAGTNPVLIAVVAIVLVAVVVAATRRRSVPAPDDHTR